MLKSLFLVPVLLLAAAAAAQQAPKSGEPAQGQPPIKMNYLNVCAPPPEEQAEIKAALKQVSAVPGLGRDFEISRGRATMQDSSDSKFVRLRRDLAPESPLMNAQFSMSADAANTVETLVLRMRDPKEFHELSFEDHVSTGAASPMTVLAADTPVTRIRVERFSKPSLVLARCQGANQSAYEPLFREATGVMSRYRKALGLSTAFRPDIAWLSGAAEANKARAPGPRQHRPK
ncbi:MAG: hypothetical protein ACRD4F_16455 [Candidatus Angelobacter sp.]